MHKKREKRKRSLSQIRYQTLYMANKVPGVWGNSLRGLRSAIATERAFRIDIIVFVICTVIAAILPVTWGERALMIFSAYLPIVAELVNTAFEKTIDRISTNYHRLSGRVKDIGSAVVLTTFIGAGICWFVILLGLVLRLTLSK